MARTMRMAAMAMTAMLAIGGVALAQRDYGHDGDDGYYRGGNQSQSRQYGYQSGYRDGETKGRHEGRENDPYDYQTPDWRQATRGYHDWMGPVSAFQRGYQEGYSQGFRSGYASVNHRGWDRGRNRDNRGYGYSWYGHGGSYRSPAYNIGYEDGSSVGREDVQKRKGFNPNPRGRYDDKDHGYRREYGDKGQYRAEYTDGYRAGYEANFNYYRRY